MPDRIVIEGGIVRSERIEVLGETALSLIEPYLTRYERTTFPVLPRGTVHLAYDRNTGAGHLLVEQPPQRHTLAVAHHGRYNEQGHGRNPEGADLFTVQFPYQYFAFTFTMRIREDYPVNFTVDGNLLYWRPLPLTSEDDWLYPAAVPNVDPGGGICWGGTLHHADNTSLVQRINAMVNSFAHTTFNEDLGHRTPFGTSLTRWVESSADPLAHLSRAYWQNPERPTDLRRAAFQLQNINHQIGGERLPIAEINPSFVAIPELPDNFTVARAREYLRQLPEGPRRRMIAAVASLDEQPLTDLDPAPIEEATA
jgi:hypothetical protein